MTSKSKRILAAVMFTDIVGFTEMMHSDEDLARQKVNRHRQVLEEQHEKYEGQIINFFGDGSLSIFSSSVNAVRCAIEIQGLLKIPIEVPLRIGIDVGDIVIENENILGDAVNLASRIESFSVTGAVLISDAVYNQVKNQQQFLFKSLGKFKFKNVPKPAGIYALAIEGLIVPDQSELKGKGQQHSDSIDYLPKVFTSFLGRDKEIKEIKELLLGNKLITLTGPGGTGKTRLSIQVASEVEGDFSDGIFWVPLSSVKDINTVVMAISEHLNLKENPILSNEEVLIQFFKEKHALLVLDNFEQIVGAASIVDRLLQACPELSILISSRIILQIPGEKEYQVPPLIVPKLDVSNTFEQLKEMPSVALFTERAQASRPKFQLTPENAETIAEICIRLDGLPLGIELAAARTKIFSPKSLLNRLDKSLDVLKGGGQFPARHQTMRQTIAWSYDLLETEEQKLFRRASLFLGGSTMEAIETISRENGLSDWDIVDGVMALVDKNLLRTQESEEDLRFFMLETIREFAIEEFGKTEEKSSIKKTFINYYLELSEKATPHFYSSEAENWDNLIYKELSNLRTAINYAIELREVALAYRLGQALIPFWNFRGMTANEGIQQLEKLTAVSVPEALSVERLKILQTLAFFYGYSPFRAKAVPIFEECLAYWRQQGDKNQIGLILNDFAWHHSGDGSYQKMEAYSLEAKSIFEELSNKNRLVASLNNLGMANMWRARPLEAISYFNETFALTEQIEDRRRNAQALLNTGYSNFLMGKYDIAKSQIQESLVTFRKSSSKIFEETALIFLCFIYYEYGEFDVCKKLSIDIEKIGKETKTLFAIGLSHEVRALAEYGTGYLVESRSSIEKAISILHEKDMPFLNRTATSQATIAWDLGDFEIVRSCCIKLLTNELEQGSYSGFIPGLEIAARIAAQEGDYETAAQLFFNAQALRAELGTPIRRSERKTYEDLLKNIEENLSDDKYTIAKKNRIENQELFNLATQITKPK